jgi:sodium/pantothenate symporter
MGIFFGKVPKAAPIAATVTALIVHFSIYFGHLTPYTQPPVDNPAVASSLAIIASVIVGFGLYFLLKSRSVEIAEAPTETS